MAIKEKVKKFIAERNTWEVASGSKSTDADAPPTLATKTLGQDNIGASSKNVRQEGVDH